MTFEEAIGKAAAPGIEPGLEAITGLLEQLGDPHRDLEVIHVAGTNGKGSVCAMLAGCLREAGFRTGLYTSPHMISYNERFLIDGKMVGDETLWELFDETVKAAERSVAAQCKPPTEFELLTAMAFLWFKREKVDILVLETGMGGRFDATNLFPRPLATIITNITMDHEGFLGDTTAKIAWEKAGIIKAGVSLITACDDLDAYEVIRREFDDIQKDEPAARLIHARGECKWKSKDRGLAGQTVDLATPTRFYEDLALALPGEYQGVNLACVALAWELLAQEVFPAIDGFDQSRLTKEALRKGLASVRWPCRLELVQENPTVVLDGSHNPDGIRNLALWLEGQRGRYGQVLLVMGMVQDKDRLAAARHLDGLVSQVIITKPLSARAGSWQELAEGFESAVKEKVEFIEDCHEAVKRAIGLAGDNDLVLCTGSFYMVGELRKNWIEKGLFN